MCWTSNNKIIGLIIESILIDERSKGMFTLPQSITQEQQRDWDSQRRNQSQRSQYSIQHQHQHQNQ